MYTKSNYEKKVYDALKNELEVFLPMKKEIKKWSDRKKTVKSPLFRSYIFVYLENQKEKYIALKANGVYSYITIQGRPAIVTDAEIKAIKLFVGELSGIELTPFELCKGQKRKINFGPFAGYDCHIVDYKGNDKVMVQIDSLKTCISAELNKAHLAEFL